MHESKKRDTDELDASTAERFKDSRRNICNEHLRTERNSGRHDTPSQLSIASYQIGYLEREIVSIEEKMIYYWIYVMKMLELFSSYF